MFNQKLEFDLHLVKLECDDAWVENAINQFAASKTLNDRYAKMLTSNIVVVKTVII